MGLQTSLMRQESNFHFEDVEMKTYNEPKATVVEKAEEFLGPKNNSF